MYFHGVSRVLHVPPVNYKGTVPSTCKMLILTCGTQTTLQGYQGKYFFVILYNTISLISHYDIIDI
jgi:hypothetical protein